MKFSNPVTRSVLLSSAFLVLLSLNVSIWVFLRFVHAERQNRVLVPSQYDVQVITAEDYHRLADPKNPEVTLTDGSRVQTAPAWYTNDLPNYVRTADNRHYVLVTTRGTAHVLPYVEHYFILLGFLTFCGLGISLWNSISVQKESTTSSGFPLSD